MFWQMEYVTRGKQKLDKANFKKKRGMDKYQKRSYFRYDWPDPSDSKKFGKH